MPKCLFQLNRKMNRGTNEDFYSLDLKSEINRSS
jgi:hypothetical protein